MKGERLTLFDVVDGAFSLLLLVPFSISQRLPNVGLPLAARAPCSKRRRKLKSGNEKDERLRRIVLWFLCSVRLQTAFLLFLLNFMQTSKFARLTVSRYVWIAMASDTTHPSLAKKFFVLSSYNIDCGEVFLLLFNFNSEIVVASANKKQFTQ